MPAPMPGRAGCCWGASGSTGESPMLALCCPAQQPAEALSHFLRGDLTRSQHEEGRPPARNQQFRSLQILIPGLLLRAGGRSAPVAASPSHACRQLGGWSGLVGRAPSALNGPHLMPLAHRGQCAGCDGSNTPQGSSGQPPSQP